MVLYFKDMIPVYPNSAQVCFTRSSSADAAMFFTDTAGGMRWISSLLTTAGA